MEKLKTYIIDGKPERIVDILTDLEYYGKLHPLIRNVEKLDDPNQGLLYRITERPFSWIPINVQYMAAVKIGIDEIDYEISEIPLTKAFINYKVIQGSENGTKVQFHLTIQSKAIGKTLLLNKMINAQDQLMNSIQNEINVV